mgnify:CR=1 FL=1
MPARVSAPIDHLVAAARESFYKNLLDIGGSTMVIVPTADPTYGALTAATFKTMGEAAITATPNVALSAFTNPVGTQGVMPYVDFAGSGNSISVAADAATENVFDGGGVAGAWVYCRGDGGGSTGRIYNRNGANQLYVKSESGGDVKVTFHQYWSGDDGVWSTTARDLEMNTVKLVMVEYDSDATGNNAVISIDNDDKSLTEDTTPVGTRTTGAGDPTIVGNLATSGTMREWDGWISTFFTIDGTLTAAKRRAIYELGRGAFNY